MSDSVTINWSKTPLIPAIAQEQSSGRVLMQAYMNEEAYRLTLESGLAHYYSRSRDAIWQKGETSGNIQKVQDVLIDCDGDSILLQVEQQGAGACHTGRESCFYTSVNRGVIEEPKFNPAETYGVLDTLYHTLQERKNADPESSYTAKLLQKGDNAILKKVCEEAGEFCFAVKDKNPGEIIYECADLTYHVMVALASHDIHPDRIKQELKRRFGLSGIEEKKSRSTSS